jgi:hypothetical protein
MIRKVLPLFLLVAAAAMAHADKVSGFISGKPSGRLFVLGAKGGPYNVDASRAKVSYKGKSISVSELTGGTQATVEGTLKGKNMMATTVNIGFIRTPGKAPVAATKVEPPKTVKKPRTTTKPPVTTTPPVEPPKTVKKPRTTTKKPADTVKPVDPPKTIEPPKSTKKPKTTKKPSDSVKTTEPPKDEKKPSSTAKEKDNSKSKAKSKSKSKSAPKTKKDEKPKTTGGGN